jgi:hypothetical protein
MDGDFSDTILGLDTIPGLGVAGSLLSGTIRLCLGVSAVTVGSVCGLGAELLWHWLGHSGCYRRDLNEPVLGMRALRLQLPGQLA